MRPKAPRVGDKGETSVNSCGTRKPRLGDKCGRQVWETNGRQGGDKCKLMRPKEPRVGDKCGRQMWETSLGDKCGRQGADKGETSVNPCRPRNPEWETSVGDKCGRQVCEKSWRQVGDMWEASVNSCGPRHPEWETRGRQV